MCDFDISCYLVVSVAKTMDAGFKPHMAPERINPELNQKGYNVKSDVWSLGITMVRLGLGSALAGLLVWMSVCIGSVGSIKHFYMSTRISGSCRTLS